MSRTEINVMTGETRQITTTPYVVDGAVVLVDVGDPVPVGAVLASSLPSAAPVVPRSLTPRQIRRALSLMGYREQVEAAVAAGSLELQDAWHHALEFLRDDPMVIAMLEAVGATSQQGDQLWTLGHTL